MHPKDYLANIPVEWRGAFMQFFATTEYRPEFALQVASDKKFGVMVQSACLTLGCEHPGEDRSLALSLPTGEQPLNLAVVAAALQQLYERVPAARPNILPGADWCEHCQIMMVPNDGADTCPICEIAFPSGTVGRARARKPSPRPDRTFVFPPPP